MRRTASTRWAVTVFIVVGVAVALVLLLLHLREGPGTSEENGTSRAIVVQR